MLKYFAFVLCLTSATVFAEPPALRLLPEYTPCTDNGVRYACYTLEQQKALLALEINAQTWQKQLHLTQDALTSRTQERNLVYEQLKLADANGVLAARRIDVLTTQLNNEITQKNSWRAKAEEPVIWPYLIGGVVGILGLGFGIGAVVAGAI